MDPQTILAAISASSGDLTDLAHLYATDFRRQLESSSNGSAVGNPPFALDNKPMIGIAIVAVKKVVLPIYVRYEQIKEAVVVVISPRAAVAGGGVIDQTPERDFLKGPISTVPVEEIFDAGSIGLAVGHEQIEVPIVIEVGPCPTP